MNPIDIALQIAIKAHAGITDRDGHPYILHPLTVGLMGNTDEEKIVGFLHDVVEDSEYSFDDLLAAGIPVGCVNALRLLTHNKAEKSYIEYLHHVINSGNPIAIMVKFHDLSHNYARGKKYPDLQKKHGEALKLIKTAVDNISHVTPYVAEAGVATAIFACGCFWGVQHQFSQMPGVHRVLAGYTGGHEECPSYIDVRANKTGHVEAVLVEYDPSVTDYEALCKLFFEIHDPAQTNGVGPDIGPQYRSELYFEDEAQEATALSLIADLRSRGYKVNTLLKKATTFYIAEEYHQNYYDKTGGEPYCHVRQQKFQ